MPDYKRNPVSGGTFFFTVVAYERQPWLCSAMARDALRTAIKEVREKNPFAIDAWVLLPDHLHCLWTLPESDHDFSMRWRLIKSRVSRQCANALEETAVGCVSDSVMHQRNPSRARRGERNLWQRRFWEHTIRDDKDYIAHCDYIHYNPVKHGLCASPGAWPYSTFHRFVAQGIYPADWGSGEEPKVSADAGKE